ncbi:MAG: DUF4124 domain-containing protein [Steroidobacteraceae bacterium]
MKRVLLCTALILWSAMASAVVYKWVDAQGKTQYGDRPPDGVHADVVELLGTHVPHAAAPAPAAPSSAPRKAQNTDQASRDAKNAVAQDVAESREKQCADAQDRYKKLIEGRRLYKTGPDGERQYLTSDEIDAERLNAKHDVDGICNSAS